MKRHVHYEAAFRDYLQQRRIAHVAVDECRQAAFGEVRLKSFDFIVYSATASNWLADVKGRRWAPRRPGRAAEWQNWVTQADLDGLSQWAEVFGSGFGGLLVFAYWISSTPPEPPPEVVHCFRDERYVFAAVPVSTYRQYARLRSPRWGTVNMPRADFARVIRPVADWL